MAITVTSLGAVQSSSSATSSTLTGLPALDPGDVIHLAVTLGPGQTISSIGGTLGVIFSPAVDSILDASAASFRVAHYVGVVPVAKAAALNILVNYSAASTQRGVLGTLISGVPLGTPLDFSAHGTGLGSGVSNPTGTLTAAADQDAGVIIAAVVNDGAFAAAPTGGYTETQDQAVGTNKRVQINHRVFTSGMQAATGYTANITGTPAQSAVMLVALRAKVLNNAYCMVTNAFDATATSATSITTPAAAFAADVGSLVLVRVGSRFAAGDNPVVTDSAGNTYTKDVQQVSASVVESVAIFSSVITSAIVENSTTFTCTWTFIESNRVMDVIVIPNPSSSTPLDGIGSGTQATGTAATTSNVTPSTARSVAVFGVTSNVPATAVTPQATWTEDLDVALNVNRFETQTKILTSTATINGAATVGSGRNAAALAVYSLSAGSTPAAVAPAAAASVSSSTCAITAPTLVVPANAASASAATGLVTAPLLLALAAAASVSTSTASVTVPASVTPANAASASSSTGAVTAPTFVTPAPAASLSTSSGLVTAATRIAPASAASTSTSTLALSAATLVAPQAAASTSASTGLVTAQTLIQTAAAASVSSSTGTVTSGGAQIAPANAASVSSSAAQITAQTRISLGAAASTSGSTGAVTAQTFIVPSSAASVSASTGTVTAVGGAAIVPGTAASVSASSVLVTAATRLTPNTSTSVSASSASVTAAVGLNPSTAGSSSASTGVVTATTLVQPAAAASVSSSTGSLRTGARVIPAPAASASSSTGALMTGAKLICAAAASVSTSVGGVTIFGHDLPARIRGRGGRAPELDSHPAAGIDSTPSAPLVDDGISSRDPRAVELRT